MEKPVINQYSIWQVEVIANKDSDQERRYSMNIPGGAPLGEAYDATYLLLMEVAKKAQQIADQTKRQEEPPVQN